MMRVLWLADRFALLGVFLDFAGSPSDGLSCGICKDLRPFG